MTTTTIRVSEPRELLAYMPYRLGFRPRESAVVMSLRGARGRLGLVARVDLADLADPENGPLVASGLATHLWRDGAEQAMVVLYTDDARAGAAWRPEVVAAAVHALDAIEARVGPGQVWVVDADRYYNLDCSDEECCPARGWPLDELDSTQVSAQMVYTGASVAGHRGELAEVVPAAKSARYNVRRVADRWAQRGVEARAKDRGASDRSASAAWHVASLRSWGAVVAAVAAGERPAARDLGRVDAALRDSLLRDAVVLGFVTSVGEASEAVAGPAESASTRIAAAFGSIFDADGGLSPHQDHLQSWNQALREVVAHAPDAGHAPALTLLAFLAWWSGDGAAANCWLERALEVDHDYRFAELLSETLAAGLPPGWARRSATEDAALR